MVKKSATLLVLLLTLSLGAFAGPHFDHNYDLHHESDGGSSVPEPGSLLVFGTGILLSIKALRRSH
jgi:hypothetical protein